MLKMDKGTKKAVIKVPHLKRGSINRRGLRALLPLAAWTIYFVCLEKNEYIYMYIYVCIYIIKSKI